MKCPKCHFENPEDTNFCGKCATPLLVPQTKTPADLKKTVKEVTQDLAAGTLIAAKYRILGKLGAGGMGEVYRAEDLSLSRQVAIKVLPDVFAADEERLARFQREAKVLASLNHPNIAAIYGVEEGGGKRYLVLELVEGETLGERLIKGPLSLEETLDVCHQIAEGLEAAHEKAIIHRDLKPANVKITPEGKAKILDFGLAKAFVEELTAVDIANSPTITADMTQPGVILGTAAYMSPEQAKARPADKRSDIWAFGCILFECLAGKRAFPGDTVSESMAAVIRGEPDWASLPADLPQYVHSLLRRCLEKDPRKRLHDIADARVEIEAPLAFPSEAAAAPRRISPAWLAAGVSVAFVAGLFLGRALTKHRRSASPCSVVTSTIKLEPGYWMQTDSSPAMGPDLQRRPSRTAMTVSNEGDFIIYAAVEENPGPQAKPRLFLRRMDQPGAKPIAGTEGGFSPFLSPDNLWVGFWADGKLKKVPVEGGVAAALCDVSSCWGASWGIDNTIVFSDWQDVGLFRVSAEGGKPEILTEPDPRREEASHRLPFWLPDGKGILFTVMRHCWDRQPWLALFRMDTREWSVLLQDAADARYVPQGYLVFLRQGTLMAVPFDLSRLEVAGQPSPLVDNVMQTFAGHRGFNTGAGQFSVSRPGSLVYAAGGITPDLKNSLVWVDQKGQEQPVTELQLPFGVPRLSPDGQRIAYLTTGQEGQVWVYDLSRGTNSRLTGEGRAHYVIWTPDGRRLLFGWHKSLESNLFWQPYDGSASMERLTTSEYAHHPGSLSPDGKLVALVETGRRRSQDIAVLDVQSRRLTPFLNSQFMERYPEFSPDGRWIAYTSNETGRFEVYVQPFPGPGMKHQASNEGGTQPLWAKDGKQLFYRWQDQVWVVDVRADGGFATSRPRLLFERPGYMWSEPMRDYDLSPDGRQFLMVKLEQSKPAPVTEMILVQNWLEELKRLVPGGKK